MLNLLICFLSLFVSSLFIVVNIENFYYKNINLNVFYNFVYFDYLALILFSATIWTLFICITISDNKYLFNKKSNLYLLCMFIIFLFLFFLSSNIFSIFLFYEFLLIPSYFIVLNTSPNRRSKITSNYFILWTQMGSFLVLLGVLNIYKCTNNVYFLTKTNIDFLTQIFIFFGFGIKIPLWPFHFWLSKTHVEANTGFSIFLSGILVKTAVYGLYKFLYIFSAKYMWFFLSICFISLTDASIKMCVQNDLKKLVAFSTIQEMGLITCLIFVNTYKNNFVLYVFVVFHTFISGLFFWIVDCLYRRYKTRIIYNINGVVDTSPSLALFIVISTYIFMGLPFTIKFSIELYILKTLLNFNIIICIFVGFLINYISMIFFFKSFVFLNFGSGIKKINDISKKELFVFIYFLFAIISVNFL